MKLLTFLMIPLMPTLKGQGQRPSTLLCLPWLWPVIKTLVLDLKAEKSCLGPRMSHFMRTLNPGEESVS